MLVLLLMSGLCSCTNIEQQSAAPRVDFSGIDVFWSIADRLKTGQEPDKSSWDSLFSTPGYAAIEAREKRRSAITDGIRMAMNPRLAARRDSVLATKAWTARVIRHVHSLADQRQRLDSVRNELQKG